MSVVPEDRRERALSYLFAAVIALLAVVVAHALQPLAPASATLPLILAVAVAAFQGGAGPGAAAAVLGALALVYWFLPPARSIRVAPDTLTGLLAFLAVAGVTAWVGGMARRRRQEALRQVKENERLRGTAEEAAAEAEIAAQEAAEALARQLEAEKALRQSERELSDFFENASIPIHWVAGDGTILRVNQAELTMLGYSREDLVGRNFADFHVESANASDLLDRLRTEEVIRGFGSRMRCKDGRIKDVVIDSSAYVVDGRFVHSRCFTRDVTLEKQAHEAITRLAAIVASSSDAIIGKTLDGVVTNWNAAAERIFGYSAGEMVGQSIYRIIPEDLHQAERDILDRLRRGESVAFAETERMTRDGRRIWISLSISPIRDVAGRVTGAASIKRDITERKQAEAELRRREEQVRLAHQAARLGSWRWDLATDTVTWDDELRRLWELDPGQEVRRYQDFLARVHPEDREEVERAVRHARETGGNLDHEFRVLLPDGRVRWLADMGRVTLDAAGKPLYLAGVCMDVTERRTVEEHLRDAQRIQTVGQLAGGIAHEANNQMTIILGALQFLLRRSDLPLAARQDLAFIRQAAERTASISRQLLAFGRKQLLQLQDVCPDQVVRAIEPVLRRSLAEHHELVLNLNLARGRVRADPRQLEQVLLNLTLNARDAMVEGGVLTVETTEEDGSAVIVVRDTGHGMDAETLKRAFEPFFTTKQVGQGTGLGLSVVHGIVGQTGGRIRVESEPGRGTTFRLYFPMVAPEPDPQDGDGDTVPEGAGGVALVVEDDPLVRTMLTRGLAEAGFSTLEATQGREALDVIRSHTGRLDLVITDLGMPEMDGYALARRLQAERPTLPILFISGYGDAAPPGPLLPKPFDPELLVRKVREVLTPPASSPARRPP